MRIDLKKGKAWCLVCGHTVRLVGDGVTDNAPSLAELYRHVEEHRGE